MTLIEALKKAKKGQIVTTISTIDKIVLEITKGNEKKDKYFLYTSDAISEKWEIKKTKKEGWINMYLGGRTSVKVFKSIEDAKSFKMLPEYVATIKIEWEE